MYFVSSTINPIICMTFVSSYRRGLREILSWCWSEPRLPASNPRSGVNTEQITFQEVTEIPETRDIYVIYRSGGPYREKLCPRS